ncbi:UNVERIFIED_CONTAM: protein RRP6-like 2, partial [Sesamum calycinum]
MQATPRSAIPAQAKGATAESLPQKEETSPLPLDLGDEGHRSLLGGLPSPTSHNRFQEIKKTARNSRKQETLSRNSRKQETPSRNRGFGVFWGGNAFPDDEDVESDDDAAFDWLVNVSNEISERIDVSLDQFKKLFGGLGAEGVQEVNVVANGERKEKLSVLGFVDRPDSAVEPVKPLPIEVTPFKLVEDLKGLKQLAIKLRNVDEFAVDLEHNQYRSFQGLTCLMQISTRTEDFIIDTLRLRVQIGPHLREVLHGADRDIVWLQRDFGIYVCNMFDTGQPMTEVWLKALGLEGIENGKAQPRIPVESFLWSRGKQRETGKTYEVLRLQLPVINFPSEFRVLISMVSSCSCLFQASGILAEMRSTYGANDCPKTSISNNKQYRYFLNADDVEEVGSRIHDFSAKHIIPLMELKIGVLNQQVYFVLEVV